MLDELLPYAAFRELRLAPFLTAQPALREQVAQMEGGWKYLGGTWLGEGLGFTDFLCLEDMPSELGCISLDLSSLPDEVSHAILDTVGLPLRRSMQSIAIDAHLGSPERTHTFVADRETFDYTVGHACPYRVSCTVHDKDGLIYLVVARKDVLVRCEAD